jgi:hypothetical protein
MWRCESLEVIANSNTALIVRIRVFLEAEYSSLKNCRIGIAPWLTCAFVEFYLREVGLP